MHPAHPVVREPVHQRASHHHAVGQSSHPRRLFARRDAEPDGDRQRPSTRHGDGETDTRRDGQRQRSTTLEPGAVQVTEAGWYLVRAVAMTFDRHLKRNPAPERFSRIV